MRLLGALLPIAMAACGSDYDPGPGSWDPPGPGGGAACDTTAACTGTQVCTRNHECLEPAQVHAVLVHWTIRGAPADESACASMGKMSIGFAVSGTGERTGFSPLMCTAGQFFIDVWPTRFDQTTVSGTSTVPLYGTASLVAGDAEADVTVDLEP
jgi:hypothetical protein